MKRGKVTNRLLDRYLGIPALNVAASFRRTGKFPRRPKRIGIFLNPALGDTMLASAPIQDIRSTYPSAKLILFAARPNLAAAKLLPGIDGIEVLTITQPLKAIRILRKARLDLMLDFTCWQRVTALYTLLSGATYRIGFSRVKQYRHRAYDATVPHLPNCHELENMRRLAAFAGAQPTASPRLLIPDGPLPAPSSRFANFVVFHPWATGTFRALREWPEEKWVQLAARLEAPGRSFVVTGGPSDEQAANALVGKIVARGLSASALIGRNGLEEVARVLLRAQMLVSVNTGIMHLAAILGTPTVALNGPTNPHRWGPVGLRTVNVPTSDGSGAFLDLGFEFNGQRVMDKITVDAVIEAIDDMLTPATESHLLEEAVPA